MIVAVDDWTAQASLARRRVAVRSRAAGHPHPEFAAALVVARGEAGLGVDEFAASIGCRGVDIAGVESGAVHPRDAPPAVRRVIVGAYGGDGRAARVRGCLLAGAVGDALGAGIEFDSIAAIRARWGSDGVRGFVPAYGRRGAITDDTQMTLFTAEGLLRAWPGDDPVPSIHAAYLRWLRTQSGSVRAAGDDAWLSSHGFLHHGRAPGTTCVSVLRSGVAGSVDAPVNDRKGCGGVMRVAPVGLWGLDVHDAFSVASGAAALTHGHPSGYLSAGVLAAVVTQLVESVPMRDAVAAAVDELVRWRGHEETAAAVDVAVSLAARGEVPSPEVLASLGEGWVGEEALAIGLFCALRGGDVRSALLAAVNHSGDSDSTGAICGNLVGAELGVDLIPEEWLDELEGRDVIEAVADDLLDRGASHPDRWPVG